jgi:hypothetical protein
MLTTNLGSLKLKTFKMTITFHMQELECTGKIPNDLTCFSLSEVDVFLDAGKEGTTIHFFKHQVKPET